MPPGERIERRYYAVAEAADRLSLKPATLRSWLRYFPFLRPRTSKKGTLRLTVDQLEDIRLIHHLTKVQGYTLRGVARVLKERKRQAKDRLRALDYLKELRHFLAEIREKIRADDA